MKKRVLIAQNPFQFYSFGKRLIERIKPPQMMTNAAIIIKIADVLILFLHVKFRFVFPR